MRELNINSFDGTYFLCTDKEGKYFAIPKDEMPSVAKPGDRIVISDEGKITVK